MGERRAERQVVVACCVRVIAHARRMARVVPLLRGLDEVDRVEEAVLPQVGGRHAVDGLTLVARTRRAVGQVGGEEAAVEEDVVHELLGGLGFEQGCPRRHALHLFVGLLVRLHVERRFTLATGLPLDAQQFTCVSSRAARSAMRV